MADIAHTKTDHKLEEMESGKYYSQGGAVYLCTRDTVNPVYSALADLVGLYVEKLVQTRGNCFMGDTIVYNGLDSDNIFDALSANQYSYKTTRKGLRN